MPTSSEKHEFAEEGTTGHEWDGIEEFDNPLPRWWLWVFYATIVWSIGYWIIYPAWPLIESYTPGLMGFNQRANLVKQIETAKEKQAVYRTGIEAAGLPEILQDQKLREFARAGGKSAFAINCSQCHGSGAAGASGYPNLNDDDWLWGGDVEAIHTSIRYGIRSDHDESRSSEMPAFLADELLDKNQVGDVAEYVLSLTGKGEDGPAAERGKPLFAENCASCHGEKGGGDREFGAPRLNDAIWLYGGDKKSVVNTISFSRKGVMPAWEEKLDAVTLKTLAVYIHSLGGGE